MTPEMVERFVERMCATRAFGTLSDSEVRECLNAALADEPEPVPRDVADEMRVVLGRMSGALLTPEEGQKMVVSALETEVKIRSLAKRAEAAEAKLARLEAAYRYSSAPPTEPGWYWMKPPDYHASLRRLRRRTNDAGEVYISDEDGADVARHYDDGVLWAGPIPKPEDP